MARFTIDLGEKFDELLNSLARDAEVTKAEIIKRSIASYSMLKQQTVDDRKVSITDSQDRVLKDVILP